MGVSCGRCAQDTDTDTRDYSTDEEDALHPRLCSCVRRVCFAISLCVFAFYRVPARPSYIQNPSTIKYALVSFGRSLY